VKPSDLTMTIPVIIELGGAEWIVGEGMDSEEMRPKTDEARKELMHQLIQKGLRAQLDMQSLVTGQLLIALDFYPDKPARFVGAMEEYQEIPTIPTTFQQIQEKIEELDFEELAESVKNTLQGIDDLVNSPELARVITNLNETLKATRSIALKVDAKADPILTGVDGTLKDTRQLVRHVDEQAGPLLGETRDLVRKVDDQIDPVASDIRTVLQAASATLGQAKSAIVRIRGQIGADSALHYSLGEALKEISAAARSFRILADYLEQHPEALLRGKRSSGGK
jgi:paraquat-inducible protein B